ncbi:MAG: hypothetical protein AAFX05_08110 [Planctomycetota bacterium]
MAHDDYQNDGMDLLDSDVQNASASEPAPTMPLMSTMGEELPEESEASGAAATLNRMSSFVLLIVVIGVAGSVLFGMRKLGLGGKLELIDIKIDYPLEVDKQATSQDHQEILSQLRSSVDVKQVPPDLVQMNPFEWKGASKLVDRGDDVDLAAQEAARLRREREENMRLVDTAFRRLRLNSVKGGRVPVANISGRLVRIGDRIEEHFVIERIEGRQIELRSDDGRLHVLELK